MNIFLNDEKLDITLESEQFLGDIFKSMEAELENASATIIAIEVDGQQLSSEQIDEFLQKDINSVNEIKFTSVSKGDIKMSLKKIANDIPELANKLADVSLNLQTGKDAQVNDSIKQFADLFDYFCHIITLASLFPEDFAEYKIVDKSVAEFLTDFAPILEDFEQAFEQKDTVLIGDLAEYEILPRMEEIRIFCESIDLE